MLDMKLTVVGAALRSGMLEVPATNCRDRIRPKDRLTIRKEGEQVIEGHVDILPQGRGEWEVAVLL